MNMDRLFDGRYRITATIGSGGMGTVYLAESVNLGTKWAIKAIPKKDSSSYDLLAEPNILKKINHPSLPRIVDIGEDESNLYIVEDYIEGDPLDVQLKYRKSFDEATVVEWAKQLCGILYYLHTQKPHPIIYRDMKPSNIIVSPDNIVKVIDFGIAREYKSDSGSDTSYMGTRGYAAPEQYGTSQTDARTDIYSLGVTLYHLLTGKSPNEPPYEFKPLRQIDNSFSEGIEYVVAKCVQNDPANRYQSTVELLHDLNKIHTFNSFYKKLKRRHGIRMLITGLLLAGSVASSLIFGSMVLEQRGDNFHTMMNEAEKKLNAYNLPGALATYEEVLDIYGDRIEPYIGISQIYIKRQEYDKCYDYLLMLEAEFPECTEYAGYHYLKGTVLFDRGGYEDAIVYLEKALALDKTGNVDFMRDAAVCYAKLGEYGKAEELMETIGKHTEKDDINNYIRGQITVAQAEQLYSENRNGEFSFDNLSDLEARVENAISCFRSVAEYTEDEYLKFRAYLEMSDLYKRMRHADMVTYKYLGLQINVLLDATNELGYENNTVINEALAEAYYTDTQYDKAIMKWDNVLRADGGNAQLYINMAVCYIDWADAAGDYIAKYDKALELLLTAREKFPENYMVCLALSNLYEKYAEADSENEVKYYNLVVQSYNDAVNLAPNHENDVNVQRQKVDVNRIYESGKLSK